LGQLKPAEPFDDLLDVWLLAKKFQWFSWKFAEKFLISQRMNLY
jgi:hypothetical protein